MGSTGIGRRRFLKQAAALTGAAAGAGAGAEWAANGQTVKPDLAKSEATAKETRVHLEPRRGARFSIDHMTYYTPLQDYAGIITPASLHFMQYHASHLPDIDAEKHRLTIHGLVDRPLSFSMDDLKSLPSVSRIHFLECHANSSPMIHGNGNQNMGPPVQFVHGMTSCNEWAGVPLSVLLNIVGVKKEASWLVSEGGDPGKFTHTLPLAKAMDDVIVAYGQNGEPLRNEQGYPIRLVVPGWEGPFSVKFLSHVKLTDEPYHTWNESMNHSIPRADLGGKARWYHFQFGPKSVITRPSGGLRLPAAATSRSPDWRGRVAAWSAKSRSPPTVARAGRKRSFRPLCCRRRIPASLSIGLGTGRKRRCCLAARMKRTRFSPHVRSCMPTGASLARRRKNPSRAIHFNAMQPWFVARDGSVHDAMYRLSCSLRHQSW